MKVSSRCKRRKKPVLIIMHKLATKPRHVCGFKVFMRTIFSMTIATFKKKKSNDEFVYVYVFFFL